MLSGVALILLAVFVSVAGSLWFRSWLRSEDFRLLLNREVSHALGVEGEFGPFSWRENCLYAETYDAAGPPGQGIRSLEGRQIRADFNLRSLMCGRFSIHALEVQKVNALIDPRGEFKFGDTRRQQDRLVAGWGKASSGGGGIGRITIHDITVQTVRDAPPVKLDDLRLEVESEGDAWFAQGSGGKLIIQDVPEIQVHSMDARCVNDSIEILELNAVVGKDQGQIAVSGDVVVPGESHPEGNVNLAIDFREMPVSLLLHEDWRARVSGRCEGSFRVGGAVAGTRGVRAEGDLLVRNAVLEALPLLNQISAFTGTEQYRRIRLETARAHIEGGAGELFATDIFAESPSLLRVQGEMQLRERWISGRLDIGLAPEHLRWLPGSRTRVFVEERDGYRWAEMKLSGRVESPREDLSGRLIAAAGSEILESGGEALQKGIERAVELLEEIFR